MAVALQRATMPKYSVPVVLEFHVVRKGEMIFKKCLKGVLRGEIINKNFAKINLSS